MNTVKETDAERVQRSAEEYAHRQIELLRTTRAALNAAALVAIDRVNTIMFEQPEVTR